MDVEIFFPQLLDPSVLNRWILSSLCGAKYTHRDFRLYLVRNLIEEARRSQNSPIQPPDYLESQMRPQQMSRGSRAAIKNTGQQNSPNSKILVTSMNE